MLLLHKLTCMEFCCTASASHVLREARILWILNIKIKCSKGQFCGKPISHAQSKLKRIRRIQKGAFKA